MLFVDRSRVQMEPISGGNSAAPTTPIGATPAHANDEDDEQFRARVLAVLEKVLHDMDRRGSP